MQFLLIIIYSATLFYFAVSDRIKRHISLLALQGFLLFGIAFLQLLNIEMGNFLFILFETVIIKALIIPWFLNRIRKKNNIVRIGEKTIPAHYSLVIILGSIIFSFIFGYFLTGNDFINTRYFSIAIAAFLTGLYFIIVHKNIFTHLIGYLIIENGVFLLSLAVGQEAPFLINIAIMMDLFAGVMIFGIVINHIGNTFEAPSIEHLTQLKD